MRNFLVFLAAITVVTLVPRFAIAQADVGTEVPFSFDHGYIVVEAFIKNDKPVNVILATGSEKSSVEQQLVSRYGLGWNYAAVGPVTGRNDKTYTFCRVPDIRVGDFKISYVDMSGVPLDYVSRVVGREIFAVLGADFLRKSIVEIDFKKKVLRFLKTSNIQPPTDPSPNSNSIVLRMRPSDPITLPSTEDIVLSDGKKSRTLIDTGVVGVVSVSPTLGKELGLTVPPEKTAPRQDKIAVLKLRDFEIKDVPVLVYAKGPELARDLKGKDAVIGTVFLQNFVVTFDFKKELIALKAAPR